MARRALEITTVIGCRIRCDYCPQSKFVTSYFQANKTTLLPLKDFKQCLDKLPENVEIDFSGFSEPFLNPDCTEMLTYASKKGFKIKVFTTAIGLSLKTIDILKEIEYEAFCLHLPDNQGKMKININDEYLSVIKKLFEVRIENMYCVSPGLKSYRDVHSSIRNFLKKKHFEKILLNSRANNITIEGKENVPNITGFLPECKRLYRNILLPNGDVILCCSDWGLKHRLGNLLISSYEALFESEEFLRILKGLNDESIDILCRTCDEMYRLVNKKMLISFKHKRIK